MCYENDFGAGVRLADFIENRSSLCLGVIESYRECAHDRSILEFSLGLTLLKREGDHTQHLG